VNAAAPLPAFLEAGNTYEDGMKIFVAGATGAVGRRLVLLLVAAGHSVVGLTRTPAKAQTIRELGAQPVVADGLDAEAIHAAIGSTKPEVIIHEMTDLAGQGDLRHFDRAFAASNQLRTRGTDLLLAAGREAGVKRFIAQSFCGWPFARTGAPVKSESDPLDPDPPAELSRALEAIQHLERTVTASSGPRASCCDMERSTAPAPACSLPRWSSRSAVAGCR
jgi:nucleoside-diphosphate-sugar epimerase